jgi:hypothetical protein
MYSYSTLSRPQSSIGEPHDSVAEFTDIYWTGIRRHLFSLHSEDCSLLRCDAMWSETLGTNISEDCAASIFFHPEDGSSTFPWTMTAIHQTTFHHIPVHSSLHSHCHDNLKSHIFNPDPVNYLIFNTHNKIRSGRGFAQNTDSRKISSNTQIFM